MITPPPGWVVLCDTAQARLVADAARALNPQWHVEDEPLSRAWLNGGLLACFRYLNVKYGEEQMNMVKKGDRVTVKGDLSQREGTFSKYFPDNHQALVTYGKGKTCIVPFTDLVTVNASAARLNDETPTQFIERELERIGVRHLVTAIEPADNGKSDFILRHAYNIDLMPKFAAARGFWVNDGSAQHKAIKLLVTDLPAPVIDAAAPGETVASDDSDLPSPSGTPRSGEGQGVRADYRAGDTITDPEGVVYKIVAIDTVDGEPIAILNDGTDVHPLLPVALLPLLTQSPYASIIDTHDVDPLVATVQTVELSSTPDDDPHFLPPGEPQPVPDFMRDVQPDDTQVVSVRALVEELDEKAYLRDQLEVARERIDILQAQLARLLERQSAAPRAQRREIKTLVQNLDWAGADQELADYLDDGWVARHETVNSVVSVDTALSGKPINQFDHFRIISFERWVDDALQDGEHSAVAQAARHVETIDPVAASVERAEAWVEADVAVNLGPVGATMRDHGFEATRDFLNQQVMTAAHDAIDAYRAAHPLPSFTRFPVAIPAEVQS